MGGFPKPNPAEPLLTKLTASYEKPPQSRCDGTEGRDDLLIAECVWG
jgi:hypothetical protein